MISWADIYKIAAAVVPLYVALVLGYGSAKWWRMFNPNHCHAINKFNFYYVLPFFTFHFTSTINPYHMNYRILIADVIAKAIAGSTLVLWANLWRGGKFPWAITAFSLSSFNNTLVVGVPLLESMYGKLGQTLVVQCSLLQSVLWSPLLLFLLEFWRNSANSLPDQQPPQALFSASAEANSHRVENQEPAVAPQQVIISSTAAEDERQQQLFSPKLKSTLKRVFKKSGNNPNSYLCALGFIWALIAKRWNFQMPTMVEGSVMIMAKAGSGISMFSVGLFIALQERVLACGVRLTAYSMILRFVVAPLTMAVGSVAIGLRSNVLHIAIIQAALPQAINSFVFAQEYGLHANVLSAAFALGTILSLPLLIAYNFLLQLTN